MNYKNKELRKFETIQPKNKPVTYPSIRATGAEPAQPRTEAPVAAKTRGFFRSMFTLSGLVLSMGFTSCVDPYYSQGGGSVTTTSSIYSPGYRINSLPGGYRSEIISGNTYYYHDGSYYRPGSGGYVVVDAPRTSRYYSDYSNYSNRQRTVQTNRYYPGSSNTYDQRTQYITQLPDGHRAVSYGGQQYYQAGDRYYRRQGDRYVIVTRPY